MLISRLSRKQQFQLFERLFEKAGW